MSITVRHLSKSFGPTRVLSDIDLAINTGELVALLGPSGSGKTTLLRIIAGMEQADAGSGGVAFDGQDITPRGIGERRIGFVFQHYALFKTMSVFENIAFGLRAKPWRTRPREAAIRAKVGELLELVQLRALADRTPSQLSGGQRQRVALARALAVEPRVLLLDEPFGALDATVRRDLRRWLRKLHETIHVTTLFVTHDQEEALEVSDRVAVMRAGRIEQFGTPQQVYEHPATPFVFQFLGHYNMFSARSGGAGAHGEREPVTRAFVRPHDVVLDRTVSGPDAIPARIVHVGLVGPVVRVELQRLDSAEIIDAEITLDASRALGLTTGETVFVTARREQVFEDYAI